MTLVTVDKIHHDLPSLPLMLRTIFSFSLPPQGKNQHAAPGHTHSPCASLYCPLPHTSTMRVGDISCNVSNRAYPPVLMPLPTSHLSHLYTVLYHTYMFHNMHTSLPCIQQYTNHRPTLWNDSKINHHIFCCHFIAENSVKNRSNKWNEWICKFTYALKLRMKLPLLLLSLHPV